MGKYLDMYTREVSRLDQSRQTEEEDRKKSNQEVHPLAEKVLPYISKASAELAEKGIESWRKRCWVDVPDLNV